METSGKAGSLVQYIASLEQFTYVDYADGNYNHMGATISDAILQAGTKYDTVVRPRIARIRELYPEATTTSAFRRLLREEGEKKVLAWRDEEKPNRVVGLTEFLIGEGIEIEAELSSWLEADQNRSLLLHVRGVGPKTIDYLRILVGTQTAAVDRHLYAMLAEAGIPITGYQEARDVLNAAADLVDMNKSHFDHSIWQHMSRRKLSYATKRCSSRR